MYIYLINNDSRDCPSFVPKETKGDCPESYGVELIANVIFFGRTLGPPLQHLQLVMHTNNNLYNKYKRMWNNENTIYIRNNLSNVRSNINI